MQGARAQGAPCQRGALLLVTVPDSPLRSWSHARLDRPRQRTTLVCSRPGDPIRPLVPWGPRRGSQSVLKVALLDLGPPPHRRAEEELPCDRRMGRRRCGMGRSFRMLKILFRAHRLIGIDIEDDNLEIARRRAQSERLEVDFLRNDCAAIDLPDGSADLLLCHQTFHHLVRAGERALARVSPPDPEAGRAAPLRRRRRRRTSTRGSSGSSSPTGWTSSGRRTST